MRTSGEREGEEEGKGVEAQTKRPLFRLLSLSRPHDLSLPLGPGG